MKQLLNKSHSIKDENTNILTLPQDTGRLYLPIRKLIIFISVIFFLFSCEQYYNIPEDKKPLLANKDIIYYLDSANNRIDTFCIKIENYYEARDMTNHWENINVRYLSSNKHTPFEEFHSEYGVNGVSNSIDGQYYRTIRKGDNNTDIIKNNVIIHGIIYPIVYVLQAYDFPDSIPSTIYFTFQYGIIRYDYSKSRHYEVVNK